MTPGGGYVEVGSQCPRFRYVQWIGASIGAYSRACPILYELTHPTLCQPMLCGVNGSAGGASVLLCQWGHGSTYTTFTVGCPRSMLYGGWSIGVSNWHRGICGRRESRRPYLCYYVWLEVPHIHGFSICAVVHSCQWAVHMPCPQNIGWHERECSRFYLHMGGFPLNQLGSTCVRRLLWRKPSVRRISTFSQEGAPYILGLYRVEPIHLDLSTAGVSLSEHERWHISI